MIKGIGTDIVEISRIEQALQHPAFINRIFTKSEQEYCMGRKAMAVASFAARFAAKEAVAKAMGTGIRKGSWLDIQILNDNLGAPRVELLGEFKHLAKATGIRSIYISLSHCREYAVAQVVLEG